MVHSNLRAWQRRLQQMKECKSITDLVRLHGEPPHKVPQEGFEVWHYPLGVAGGTLYSIHVSVWPDQARQIYMHMEPTSLPETPVERPRFSQAFGRGASEAFRFLGRIFGRRFE